MDRDKVREELEGQISALVRERAATGDAGEKTALSDAIASLQDAVDDIDIAAADQLGATIDGLIGELQAVQNAHRLDAASALGRSIDRLRTLAQGEKPAS